MFQGFFGFFFRSAIFGHPRFTTKRGRFGLFLELEARKNHDGSLSVSQKIIYGPEMQSRDFENIPSFRGL